MAPGYGGFNKGGIETNLGNKLCSGDYILSFDLSIPYPALNMSFGFEIYLNSAQNKNEKKIFELGNSDGSNLQPGIWRHFERTITIENSDDLKYDWFSLINERCAAELEFSNIQTIFVDNVSFVDKCMKDAGPCSPYIGKPNPKFVQNQYSNTICVTDLQNIKDFKLEIVTANGVVIRTIPIIDPADNVCWDQKTDAGTNASPGPYFARMSAKTNCCKIEKTSTIFQRYAIEIINPIHNDYNQKDKLKTDNCCNPNIIITNEIIDNVRDYIGPQKITLGPNVTIKNTANVLLQAGVNIEIIEPIFIEENAIFEARIGNCTAPSFKRNNLTNAIDSSKNSKKETINWFLSPNPSSTNIKIRNYDQSDRVNFIIYDMHGKEVFKMNNFEVLQTIDISNFAKGVYYLNLIGANGIEVKKFIKY